MASLGSPVSLHLGGLGSTSSSSDNSQVTSVQILPEMTSVDVPILVKDVNTAYDLLGGEAAVKHTLNYKEDTISMSFHSSQLHDDGSVANFNDSGVIGTREKCCGLVLRFRRKKSDNSTQVSVVGKVLNKYEFNEPADFQVSFVSFCQWRLLAISPKESDVLLLVLAWFGPCRLGAASSVA
jgi:hypothetical protein